MSDQQQQQFNNNSNSNKEYKCPPINNINRTSEINKNGKNITKQQESENKMSEYIENVERKTSERKEYQRKVANAFRFWKAESLLIKPVNKDRINKFVCS